MKRAGRRLERLCKKTSLTGHTTADIEHLKANRPALTAGRTSDCSTLTNSASCNLVCSFLLFISSQPPVNTPAASDELCISFMKYIQSKIVTLYQFFYANSNPPPTIKSFCPAFLILVLLVLLLPGLSYLSDRQYFVSIITQICYCFSHTASRPGISSEEGWTYMLYALIRSNHTSLWPQLPLLC